MPGLSPRPCDLIRTACSPPYYPAHATNALREADSAGESEDPRKGLNGRLRSNFIEPVAAILEQLR